MKKGRKEAIERYTRKLIRVRTFIQKGEGFYDLSDKERRKMKKEARRRAKKYLF